jgi:hypothetical protein
MQLTSAPVCHFIASYLLSAFSTSQQCDVEQDKLFQLKFIPKSILCCEAQ